MAPTQLLHLVFHFVAWSWALLQLLPSLGGKDDALCCICDMSGPALWSYLGLRKTNILEGSLVGNELHVLRELLGHRPSRALFERVVALFGGWETLDTLDVGLTYAREHLSVWDAALCAADLPVCWPGFPNARPLPGASLVRSLDIGMLASYGEVGLDVFIGSSVFAEVECFVDHYFDGYFDVEVCLSLLSSGHFPSLHQLELDESHMGVAAIEKLASTPVMEQITSLNLKHSSVCNEGLKALVTSPHLKNLTHLDLRANIFDEEGVLLLSKTPHWGQLTSLDLSGNIFDTSSLSHILANNTLPRLSVFRFGSLFSEAYDLSYGLLASGHFGALSTCRLVRYTDEEGARLSSLPARSALKQLTLVDSQMSAQGLRALLNSALMADVEALSVELSVLDAQKVAVLLECSHCKTLDLISSVIRGVPEGGFSGSLRELHFGTLDLHPNKLRQLLDAMELSQVETLTCQDLGVAAAKVLASSPNLTTLRKLTLAEVGGVDGCRALAASASWPRLSELTLKIHSDEELLALAKNSQMRALTHLVLDMDDGACSLSGVEAFTQSALFSQLQSIRTTRGLVWFRLSHKLSPGDDLMRLFVEECWDTEGLEGERLRQALYHPAIRHLSTFLFWEDIGLEEAKLIASSPYLCSVKKLMLSRCDLKPEALALLLEGPCGANLEELDLSGNPLGDEGVKMLAQVPQLSGLRALHLDDCGVTSVGIEALATSPHLLHLRLLSLPGNPLGPESMAILANAPFVEQLATLWLAGAMIGDEGVRWLASSPRLNNLRELDLCDNELSDVAAQHIAGSASLSQLKELDLGELPLGMSGANALVGSPLAGSLHRLDLSGDLEDGVVARILFSGQIQPALYNSLTHLVSHGELLAEARRRGLPRPGSMEHFRLLSRLLEVL